MRHTQCSPFKGQGANQALLDAVSLVKSVQRSQVGFGSTVIARTSEATSIEAEREINEMEEGNTYTTLDDGRAVYLTIPGVNLSSSLRDFESEMAQRARIKVLKSREAAEQLHSQRAMSRGDITRAMAATLSRDVSERLILGKFVQ